MVRYIPGCTFPFLKSELLEDKDSALIFHAQDTVDATIYKSQNECSPNP